LMSPAISLAYKRSGKEVPSQISFAATIRANES
jgi:hypothetical protein